MRPNLNRRSLSGWLILFGLCVISPKGQSEEVNISKGDMVVPGATSFHGQVQWENIRYLVALQETEHLNSSQFVSTMMNYQRRGDFLDLGIELSLGRYVEFAASTFTLPEAYAGTGRELGSVQLSFGRRRLGWNHLDREWQLGVYQPIHTFDVLNPVEQGLTGLFVGSESNSWRWWARYSPLFIPSQGAPIEGKNGKLSAPTRFFRPPSGSTLLVGRPTAIAYDLQIPPYGELLIHSGYSMLLGYGDPEQQQGGWGQFSFSDKPNPNLLISFQGMLALTEEEGRAPQGDVTLSPYVSYHRVYGADLGYNWNDYRLVASVLADEPYRGIYTEDWTRQETESLRALMLQLSFPTWPVNGKVGTGDISYLGVDGGGSQTANANTEGEGALFPDRVHYKSALRLRLSSGLIQVFGRPLSTKLRWLWDFESQGLLMTTELRYLYQDSVALLGGIDIIGVPGASEDNASPSFFNQYRSNDRIYGGLSYVF